MWSDFKNRYFYATAVIDNSLHVKKADEEFYSFAGENALYSLTRIIHPSDLSKFEKGIDELEKLPESFVAVRMVKNDGEYRWMLIRFSYDTIIRGSGKLIFLEMQDITTFKDEIDELKDYNETYGEYFSLMEYLMLSYDVDTDKLKIFMMGNQQQINFYNGSLTDWQNTKLINGDIESKDMDVFDSLCESMKSGEKNFEYEIRICLLENDSEMEWCLIKGKTIMDAANKKHVIATLSKINPITKKREVDLTIESVKDAGTDLLNKRTITKYAKDLLGEKPNKKIVFAVLDLDNFKYINDTFGHMFGDEVLFKVAEIVKEAVGEYGVVGRIGGDELFAVLDNNIQGEQQLRGILRTIRANVEWAYKDTVNLSCSIGCSCYPQDADNYTDLFNIADKALYLAKEKGKNRYIIYEKELHGKYVEGKGNFIVREKDLYKHNKINLVNEVLSEFLYNKTMSTHEACERIGLCFELEDISIFIGKDRERTAYWGIFKDVEFHNDYFDREHYIKNFDDNNLFVIDNINILQGRYECAYEAFVKDKISAAVQYLIGTKEDPKGFITFNKSKLSRKWTELDIHYLSLLGKVFELYLLGNVKKENVT